MRPTNEKVGILLGDVHLRHTKPPARAEASWYDVMDRYLGELCELQAQYDVPVFIAGDIFHKWNSPAELINFAIRRMPKNCWTIPGQHDLPYHNYEDIKRSAYWTLVEAGAVNHLDEPNFVGDIWVVPFPWGRPVVPLAENTIAPTHTPGLTLAMVHAYIYTNAATSYPGAPPDKTLATYLKQLKGYNAAVFGDNHKSFTYQAPKGCSVFNGGTFIPTNSDERNHMPTVAWLLASGQIWAQALLKSQQADQWLENAKLAEVIQTEEFMKALEQLEHCALDYPAAVRHALGIANVSKAAAEVLLGVIDGG